MSFPRIKRPGDIPEDFITSTTSGMYFCGDGEIRVRVFATNKTSIRNPGKHGPFVRNGRNFGGLE